ncbi:MAG: 6-bladed beta-propeller [Candidatus Aminicenantes bacterium]|nr:6-bladed beta-propeller [Candidatus Aminicenantes bacterium]
MRKKLQCELLIFLAICLSFSISCSKSSKDTEWSANIEIVDGIKVVFNPGESKYGEFAFELEEDLAIGDVNDEDYFFPRRVTLNVDGEGNIYVCDRGNRRVQKYDKNGRYVRTIGRQGQGPGEYRSPSRLYFDDVGNPCVRDSRYLLYYDKDGVFQKKVQLKRFYSRLIPGPDRTFLGSTQPNARAEGGAKTSIIQVGENGETIQTIAEYTISYNKSLKATVLHWYTNFVSFAQRTSDSFYYGFPREYKVNVADSEGSTIFVFAKEEKPQSISGKEKELTIKDGIYLISGTRDREKAIAFSDHRPFFKSFFSDDTGRLYVILFKSILEREKPMSLVDVFSKDGIYLYQINWTFIPALIKNGFLYEVSVNEEIGDVKVIRYKITNWSKFKTD